MTDTFEQQRLHRAKWGGYNDLPPNWLPCEPSVFWGQFMTFANNGEEYRQVKIDGKTRSVRLYFYAGDEGLALVQNLDGKYQNQTPLTYKFSACQHEYEVLPQRFNCYHESKCKKCGHVRAVDSSG